MMRIIKNIVILAILIFCGKSFAQWNPPVQLTDTVCFTDSRAIAVGETLHVVGEQYMINFYYLRSNDNGVTWSDLTAPAQRPNCHAYMPDIIYSNGKLHLCWGGTVGSSYQHVYHMSSSDGGRTWGEIHQVFYTDSNLLKDPRLAAKGDTLFLICNDGRLVLYRSNDAGVIWGSAIVIEDGDIAIASWPCIFFTQNRLNLIYEMGMGGDSVGWEVYHRYSTNKGSSWSNREYLSTPDHHASQVPSAAADTAGNIMAIWFDYKYGSYCGLTGDILGRVSTDNGSSWLPECRLTNTQTGQISACQISNGNLYAVWNDARWFGCNYFKLYFSNSTDWGLNWSEPYMISDDVVIGERFPAFAVTQEVDSTYFHAFFDHIDGSTNDLYYIKGQQELTGINWTKPILPEALSLSAYPNPFNSSTSVGYDLPKASDITLAIFDILGRKVATLVDGHQAAGHHEVIWNASAYSSGVYFARASGQNNSSVIKLIYLK